MINKKQLFIMVFSIITILGCHEKSEIESKIVYPKTLIENAEKSDSVEFNSTPVRTLKFFYEDSTVHFMIPHMVDSIGGAIVVKYYYDSYLFSKEFYGNGQARNNKRFYINGEPHGEFVTYYEDGRIKVKGKLEKGVKVGTWKYYDEDGYLEEVKHYDEENTE